MEILRKSQKEMLEIEKKKAAKEMKKMSLIGSSVDWT